MEIQNTKYDKHVIGDNVALSFDNFYSDIDTLKQDCPNPFYYPIPVNRDESVLPEWAEPIRYELSDRIPEIPVIEEKLFPRLAPSSPAGPVTKIKNAEYNIVEILKPIIEKEYNKTISEAKVQNVASCNDDYLNHIGAYNTTHDDIWHAYHDEMWEDPSAGGNINYEKSKEYFEKIQQKREEGTKLFLDDFGTEEWGYLGNLIHLGDMDPKDIYKWIRTKSKRFPLQNHPGRPQWGDEDTFLCITVLHANNREISNLEFWKHKPFFHSSTSIDDEQNNLYSMKKEYLFDERIIPQLIYYESWHYSEMYDYIVGTENIVPRKMVICDQGLDPQHATLNYDLVNYIPAVQNKCFIFPANYFHKMSFNANWYWNEQMLTQILLLK